MSLWCVSSYVFRRIMLKIEYQSLSRPPSYDLKSLLLYSPHSLTTSSTLSTHLTPPAAPLTGITSLFPPFGERVSLPAIQAQYRDAVIALSVRLGQDEWFLGSSCVVSLFTGS